MCDRPHAFALNARVIGAFVALVSWLRPHVSRVPRVSPAITVRTRFSPLPPKISIQVLCNALHKTSIEFSRRTRHVKGAHDARSKVQGACDRAMPQDARGGGIFSFFQVVAKTTPQHARSKALPRCSGAYRRRITPPRPFGRKP